MRTAQEVLRKPRFEYLIQHCKSSTLEIEMATFNDPYIVDWIQLIAELSNHMHLPLSLCRVYRVRRSYSSLTAKPGSGVKVSILALFGR
jgi:hypothetical protein